MKKPGEWIAVLSANLEVSRLGVEANEVLDLVEVTEVDRLTERPSSVRFLDPVEGARLHKALGIALDLLEHSAIEASKPRYEPVFVQAVDGRRWTVQDALTRQTVDAPIWRGDGAEQSAITLAEHLNREADRKSASPAGP